MAEKRVTEALQGLRRKLWMKRIVHLALRGWMVGVGLAVLELIVARAWPIGHPWRLAFGTVVVGLVTGLTVGLLRRVSVLEAARFADRNGLEERMVTALSFQADASPPAVVQREEAIRRFRREEERLLGQISVWHVSRPVAAYFTLCALLGGVMWWLPNPMQDVAEERQRLRQALEKEQQRVAEVEKNVTDNEELSPEQKETLQRELAELKDQLADSHDHEEGMKALAEAQAELERLVEEATNRQQLLEGWQREWASEQAAKTLATALNKGDAAQWREAMQARRDALAQLSSDEREALADKLAQARSRFENQKLTDKEWGQALEEAEHQLRSGTPEEAAYALKKMIEQAVTERDEAMADANAADQAAQALADSKQALAQVGQSEESKEMTARGGGASNGSGGGNGDGKTGLNSPSSPGTDSPGNGSTNSDAHRFDTGEGDVSGNGEGIHGRSGNGAGIGSGSSSGSGGGGKTGAGRLGSGLGAGSGAGQGSGSREPVSVPTARLEGGGSEETVGGPLGKGREIVSHGFSIGSPGVSRPYTEVFGQYEQAARQALGRRDLPPRYHQLIKDYFTDIQPSEYNEERNR